MILAQVHRPTRRLEAGEAEAIEQLLEAAVHDRCDPSWWERKVRAAYQVEPHHPNLFRENPLPTGA